MTKKGVSTLKVAATYIGTIVGAGFATGQEVLQFFLQFGIPGVFGLVITTILFVVFGYIIMDLGRKLNAQSHVEIIKYSGNRLISLFIDIIITFFLFGGLTAMIAGTGALFEQQFNLPALLGNVLMATLTALTVITGINGVINSISFVVPFLLVAVFSTCIIAIINTSPNLLELVPIEGESKLITNWFMAAILYVSYNTLVSIAVLGPLGVEARSNKAIKIGALLGGLGLGLGSIMIYFALAGNVDNIKDLEVPMIFIAGSISSVVQILYAIVLTAEVYTTAVGSLYGFVSRIVDIEDHPKKGKKYITIATIGALLASQLGFENLVKYLYPIVGYGGIILLISLLYTMYKTKKVNNT